MSKFDQPPDDRDLEREREELLERLNPDAREQREGFVRGRVPDDEGHPVFHPLNVYELDQRRQRRAVRPSDGKDAA